MNFKNKLLVAGFASGLLSSMFLAQETLAKTSMKSTLISLPVISWGGESKLRAEFNLIGKGSIAIEASQMGETQELRESELELAPHDSMIKTGQELRLVVSRFTRPAVMGGWYWGMGLGYRKMQISWSKAPHIDSDQTLMALNDDGNVSHELEAKGITLAGRLGYRYVADNGFSAGIFLGTRHFENKVHDVEVDGADASPIYDSDRNALQRRFMTKADHGIEIGWAF